MTGNRGPSCLVELIKNTTGTRISYLVSLRPEFSPQRGGGGPGDGDVTVRIIDHKNMCCMRVPISVCNDFGFTENPFTSFIIFSDVITRGVDNCYCYRL